MPEAPRWPQLLAAPLIAAAAVVFIMVYLSLTQAGGDISVWLQSGFVGPDSWTRAYRAQELAGPGGWFSDLLLRVGPNGIEQHWSRPVDALNLLGAVVFLPFYGSIDAGLEAWAAVSGPLHVVGFVALLVWAGRPVLSERAAIFLAMLLVPHLTLWGYFYPGRIDWHPENFMAMAVVLGVVVRILAHGQPAWRPIPIAVLLSVLIWANVEGFLVVAAGFAGVGLAWVVRGDADVLARARVFAHAFAGAFLACVLLEQGPQVLQVEYDEPSIFHAALFCLHAAFWEVAHRLSRRARVLTASWQRLVFSGLGACAALLVVAAIYPHLLEGRINPDVDKTYIKLRAVNIQESAKIFSLDMVIAGDWSGLVRAVAVTPAFWVALLGLPVMIWRDGRNRWLWAGALVLVVMPVLMRGGSLEILNRTAPVLTALSLVPAACALAAGAGAVLRLIPGGMSQGRAGGGVSWARLGVMGIASALVLVLPLALLMPSGNAVGNEGSDTASENAPNSGESAIDAVQHHMDTLAALPAGTVGTFADVGPHILFRTDHRVLSIPTHRDQPGFRGLHFALKQQSGEEARRRLADLGVDYLLIVEATGMRDYFALRDGDGDTLGRRLVRGDLPAWISPIELSPAPLSQSVHLFRVDP